MSGVRYAEPTIYHRNIYVTANKAELFEFICCLSSMFKSRCLQNNCTYLDI